MDSTSDCVLCKEKTKLRLHRKSLAVVKAGWLVRKLEIKIGKLVIRNW